LNDTTYPYASGYLLASPNTYFYANYGGRDFLAAWRAERQRVAATLPSPADAPASALGQEKTAGLLEHAFAATAQTPADDSEGWRLIDQLVRRFEIFKRIHDAYDDNFRAVDREAHGTPALYLRAGEVFEAACTATTDLRYLNVLLKCLDTLCSLADRFESTEGARLARLIVREDALVRAQAATSGVAL
jgi:methionyl-tRNA formyltransferase